MSKKRIIILGAGLAGLSTAWHLQRRGIDCQIFEKEATVGGLCRSKKIGGFTFDYDGHLLHFKHLYVLNLIKKLLRGNLAEHRRNAWVYSCGKFIHYPFQSNFHGLPQKVIKECLLGIINTFTDKKQEGRVESTFLDWIYRTFGSGIAKHFMVPYNKKFWTASPKNMTCEWLHGFIPVPSLNQVIKGAFEDCRAQIGYNARFWYTKKGGINQLPLSFARNIKGISTNCEIRQIDIEKKEVRFPGGKKKFDYLISTIPLPEMPRLIKNMPGKMLNLFELLKWNSIFNLNIGINKDDIFKRHWVYFPQEQICFFRVGFFNNFSQLAAPPGSSSLYIEVSYSKGRPLDGKMIIKRIKDDLYKTGILDKKDIILVEDANDIIYGYPIYDKNYQSATKQIREFLLSNWVIGCGRYGSWKYMSMEDVILDGKRVADLF